MAGASYSYERDDDINFVKVVQLIFDDSNITLLLFTLICFKNNALKTMLIAEA